MELWDLYDEKRNVTGIIHERGKDIPDGYYHLVVHIWIKNKDGKYLISRRSSDRKSYPLYLECQGGSVIQGETSLSGAMREVMEEVGIDLSNVDGKVIYTKMRKDFHDIMDVWLFQCDKDADLSKATTKEVCETMWMSYDEIKECFNNGTLVPTLDYFFDIEGDK